ncbi:MAG: family 10 glycosylhydrolase [Oscillospiraceae bacterium]|nr:family 10 glycosylhydrolase [Oscillospiraceae bacterium]
MLKRNRNKHEKQSKLNDWMKKHKILLRVIIMLFVIFLFVFDSRVSWHPDDVEPEDIDPQPHIETEVPQTPIANIPEDEIFDDYEIIYDIDETEFRGVWLTSVLNLDFPSRPGLSADELKREIDYIVNRTAEMGLNAIIFQVRPTGDAFYESSVFPWSHWLTGTQGQGVPGFDPLAYIIEASHAKGIELHAWLNPYRIIHTAENNSDPNTLSPDNPVRQRPELAVAWSTSNGREGLFLDPGLPEARQLIIDGIIELINNYDVDGIHFDDYFYPGSDFDDAATFERYGNGMGLSDWRRENVNILIRDIQSTIREINEEQGRNVRWGISPSAIWKNDSSSPLGKPVTSTFESYHLLYADTRLWVLEEWVDYINPQIYWYIGFGPADFVPILDWWIDLCRDTNVDLYIGHAAWREAEDERPPSWRGEMVRQLELTAQSDVVDGNIFFRFNHLRGALGNTLRDFYMERDSVDEREPIMILDTLSVGFPENNVTLNISVANAHGFNIVGTSIPDIPLFVNGEMVTTRTVEGFFFYFAPLEAGTNVFTFSQYGQDDVTKTITIGGGGGGGGGGGTAPATITEVTTPRYATVTSNEAWLFPSNTISGGSDFMLERGQVDRVIAESTNNFVRLSNGMWISRNAVSTRNESELIENVLRDGIYQVGTDYDVIVWQADEFSAVHATFDGYILKLNFGMHTEAPSLTLPTNLSNALISESNSGIRNNIPYIELTIRDDANLEGYFMEYDDGEFRFYLRRRKTLAPGDEPLIGITILIDPGHGGEYSGAIGPLGYEMSEKHIVLINSLLLAERLENLGATVYLTRDSDIDVSLQERVNISRRIKPDIFLSLHVNSVAETTNSNNISGFTVWYRNSNAVSLAQTILDVMYNVNPGTNRNRNINQSNFFVCRPSWVPTVILESSFIKNIEDFVWLIDPVQQEHMADVTVEAILEYFGG